MSAIPVIARDEVVGVEPASWGVEASAASQHGGAALDVVRAAWVASGRPFRGLRDGGGASTVGRCARCDEAGGLVDVRQIVSRSFTARDGWLHPGGSGLCRACSWAYRELRLRQLPHIVQRTPLTLTALSPVTLSQALSRQIDDQVAITVPRSGRKHLLPSARWGLVLLEDIAVPWNHADAAHLYVVHDLRALGASDDDLRQPAPPWPLLRTAGPDRGSLLAGWSRLRQWREQRPAHLDIAVIATRNARATARHPHTCVKRRTFKERGPTPDLDPRSFARIN